MDDNPTPPPPPQAVTTWSALKNHRFYGAALGYLVVAWIVLQVAAIVLPGFGAPPWVLRGLMIVLALGLGATLLVVWTRQRHASGLPLIPRTRHTRLAWVLTALLPAATVTAFFLLHPLERPSSHATATAPAPNAGPAAPDKSVAVLPFENLSADKDNAFFADGVQDEVLTDLSKVADLKVISRTSVMQFKDIGNRNLPEIGKALGVAFVVEGSVQRAGNKIRVVAQLIDARTDAHRWAEHFDRDLADVFAIQSEIAQAIAGQLQAAISPQAHAAIAEVPTHDLKAYELYLRAKAMWSSTPGGDPHAWVDQMVSLLTEATQRDPDFAQAYAFLAEMLVFAYRLDPTPARLAPVRIAVETVARLRPGSADAHEAMGTYAFLIENDYARAHDELAQTVRLAPNNAKAFHLLAVTDRDLALWDDSITHFRKAAELDPEDENAPLDYINTLEGLRRYPEAIAVIDHLVATHQLNAALPMLMQAYKARVQLEWKADPRGALAALATLPASYDLAGRITSQRIFLNHCARDFAAADRALAACPLQEIGGELRPMFEARSARYRGDKPAAQKAFLAAWPLLAAKVSNAPDDDEGLMSLATIDAALGHKTDALSEARRAAAMHPLDRDTWLGPPSAGDLAIVLAWTGERAEAIRLVQTLCARPNGPGYGYLKLHPDWDALRGDPRFEAAVASLAPKP